MTETIDHPPHYGGEDNPYEAIKVIEAWGLGFNLGNAVKYISRAGKKGDRLEDLKKAAWYLNREIEFRAAEEGKIQEPIDLYPWDASDEYFKYRTGVWTGGYPMLSNDLRCSIYKAHCDREAASHSPPDRSQARLGDFCLV